MIQTRDQNKRKNMMTSKYPTMTSWWQLMVLYLILWFYPSLKPTAGWIRAEYHTRGLGKTPTTYKMESFATIVNSQKSLSIVVKCSILDICRIHTSHHTVFRSCTPYSFFWSGCVPDWKWKQISNIVGAYLTLY